LQASFLFFKWKNQKKGNIYHGKGNYLSDLSYKASEKGNIRDFLCYLTNTFAPCSGNQDKLGQTGFLRTPPRLL
jgi:hypothetical protein